MLATLRFKFTHLAACNV